MAKKINTMKKFLAIITCTTLIGSLAFGFTACENNNKPLTDGALFYSVVKESGKTVGYSVSGANEEKTEIVIPSTFKGLPVTRIDDFAFYENENIISVNIGESVTKIGDSAFYNCEKLENLTINGKVTDMGELAFAHCLALESVDIAEGVEEISYYAFFECSALKEVTIPASVKSIGESAFSFCESLEKVTLNEGLMYIGDCAFGGCGSLEELTMPQSVTELGFGVLMFVGGFMFDGEEYWGNNRIRKIVMSDNITDIPEFAFAGCVIPDISIGKGVETINYSAFYRCEWLESVVIPKSVKRIVSYAFYRCNMLNTVYYEGTAAEWASVSKSTTGNDILNAEVYYYSATAPETSGNFWHYSADGITPIKW